MNERGNLMSKLLTREQILDRTKLRRETVEVPEWGGSVIVREMTGAERDTYEADLVVTSPEGDVELREGFMNGARTKLAALSMIGDEGERLFTMEDVEALGALSAAALGRVFDVASRLSGLSTADFEELAGNSAGPRRGGSGSRSRSN
jgi:hypothetical protein